MRRSKTLSLAVAAALALGAQAKADTITLFNSGVGPGGSLLSGGSLDPHWSIIAGPGITSPISAVVLNNQQVGNYAQSTDSRWVWVNAGGVAATGSPYTFRLTFDLTGYNPSTATISGSWGVDNDGTILLNGAAPAGSGALTLLGGDIPNHYTSFHNFSITGDLSPGSTPWISPRTDLGVIGGLNVNHLVGTVTAVPEPSSVLMVAFGVAILATCSRGRRLLASPHSEAPQRSSDR
ncbi:MAG: hypothetical protein U0800_19185 [Isosphaeraceae bacterium]